MVLWCHFEVTGDGQGGANLPSEMLHKASDAVFETSDVLLGAADRDDRGLTARSSSRLDTD